MNDVLKRARTGTAVALAWAGLMAGLMGCTGDATLFGGDKAPGDTIRITPEDGAKGVGRSDPISVSVAEGRLERVRVVRIESSLRTELRGRISRDGRTWEPAKGARAVPAAKYGIHAVAVDGQGRRSARHTTFTTAVPELRFTGYFKPEHNSTVGTGMIVSFDFNRRIVNRAAVESAIRVTSVPPVEVAGHWFGDRRLDFRPREYWKPGTAVTVDLRLRNVQAAPRVFGIQRKSVRFTVGRSQVTVVDAASHTMEVRRDGKVLNTLPVTAGAPGTRTYSGKMVATEKYDVTRMNGSTVGFGGEYDIKDVPHAIRLTSSGTFLHGNYWASPYSFGSENVSHGCVGLRDVKGGSPHTPAGWFYDRTLIGDVIEVVNSYDQQVDPDNGLGGWNMDWAEWKEGSALRPGLTPDRLRPDES